MTLSNPLNCRFSEPIELLESMYAHKGKCHYCEQEAVKMPVIESKLDPKNCWCLFCGQRYYMEIEDLNKWAIEQWKQKTIENE